MEILIGIAIGSLAGVSITAFLLGSQSPPIEPPEIPDTAYDFCPRPGCQMADIHRSKSK